MASNPPPATPQERKGSQFSEDTPPSERADSLPDSLPDTKRRPAREEEGEGDTEWQYLTYDTHLPHPTAPEVATRGDGLDVPDLEPYTNPLEWPRSRKDRLIWLSCVAATVTAYGSGDYAPAVPKMTVYFGISRVVAQLGIALFTAGFAIAPMILAPFSELNGRRPIFLSTGYLFFIFVLLSGVTHLFAGMVIARFLAGCASSTFSVIIGGVISDVYTPADRNKPMTLFTMAVLVGTGLGPLISGFIAYNTSWRWVFYFHAIVIFVVAVALQLLFKETRGTVLLSRKAKRLNAWYGAREAAGRPAFPANVQDSGSGEMADATSAGQQQQQQQQRHPPRRLRWKVEADEERDSIAKMVKISLERPLIMLFTEPVVFFFTLWVSFAFSVLFSLFSAIPYTFQTVYGFNTQQSGAVFAAVSIAGIVSTVISLNQERVAKRFGKHSETPEGRLYYSCFQSALLPIGLFWFGWTARSSIHWIVPTLAIGCATMGIFSIYLAVFLYLADCYGPYASSAIAAQSMCRNLMGGAFPLFTEQMYAKLGFGGGASLMGGIGVALTLVPWVLAIYGPRIRARSPFASQLMKP